MEKNIIGIVVGQESYNRFFVWCKESKRHGILQMNPEKPIKMGNWVNLKFTSSEFLKSGESQVSSYEIISEIYETEVQGNRVLVKLEQYLMSNQQELYHPFFGQIYNARNICFPSGAYYLAIKRRADDIWIIEHLTTVIPTTKKSKVIGIVSAMSGTNEKQCSVWYKESKFNIDVILKSENLEILKVGSWLSMDLSLDPNSNIFECSNFTVIPTPIHPTFLSEKNQLCLKLEIWVPEGSKNIFHPFVGEIMNATGNFQKSGRYSITIQKTKFGSKLAWFLKQRELLEPYQFSPSNRNPNNLLALLNLAPPISNNQQPPYQTSIHPTMAPQPIASPRSTTKNINELRSHPTSPMPLQPTTPARPSNLQRKTQAVGSQSEASISTIGRPTLRQRSLSRNELRSFSPPNQPQQQPITQPDALIALLTRPKSSPNNQNNQQSVHQEPIQPTINPQPVARQRSSIRNSNEERGRAKSKRRRSKSRSPTHEITGIVVAEDAKNFFVWCRERLPGQNITIPKTPNAASLSLTSWVEFTVTSEQMSRFFLDEMPENGIYPRFQKDQFRIVSTKFPTYLNSQDKSISIEINIWIRQNWIIQNIDHEILGIIINENFVFDKSGRYILIVRNQFKNGENAESVWYLEECRLLPPLQPTPINRYPVQNGLNAVQPTTPARPSNLQRKTQALGSQSENSISTIGRQTQRQRSSSRPRNEMNSPQPAARNRSPARNGNEGRGRSKSAPRGGRHRSRSLSRPRNEAPPTPTPRSSIDKKMSKIESEAIIKSISIEENRESIFVWVFDLKEDAKLFLNVAAEKLNLEPGKVFKSTFVNWSNGKWSSHGPVTGCKDLYVTRINGIDQIEVLVSAEVLEEPDNEHSNCPWIPHPHFGDILDYRCQIQNHAGLQYTFWIRRQKLGDNYHWVVREQANR